MAKDEIANLYERTLGRSVRAKKWIVGAGLFLVLFVAMSNVGGLFSATHAASLTLSGNAEVARAAFGGSDAGSYLQAALGLRDLGVQGVGGNQWVYNLWPPGMVAVNLVLVLMERVSGVPYTFLLVSFSALAWALILSRFLWFFEKRRSGFGVLFVAFFLLSSLGSTLLPMYIGYADALAAGFLLLAVLELSERTPGRGGKDFSLYVRAAVFLSLAMHFRATYETVTSFILVVSTISVLLLVFVSQLPISGTKFSWKNPASTVFFVALGAQILSVPWRLIAGTFVRPGDFRWSTVLDQAMGMRWYPTSMYTAEAGFLKNGHANFGCINDPVRCEEIRIVEQASELPYYGGGAFTQANFQSELVESFFNFPLIYALERFSMLVSGFFSATGGTVGDWKVFEGLFLFVGVLLAFFLILKRRQGDSGGAWMAFLSIGALAGILLLFHMETRYMFPIKLLALFITFIALSHRAKKSITP